ncbi:MAG: S41 family peptidase [Acidobacteriota bacterium]
MKLFQYTTALVVTILSLSLNSFALDTKQNSVEASRIERLAKLCKLWNQIKYFHPYLAYRTDIDWDKALISTIPKVNSAKDEEEFGLALQSMINVLGDPATQLIKKSISPDIVKTATDPAPIFKFTQDNILIVNLNKYSDFGDFNGSLARFTQLSKQIINATGIIFDLRSPVTMTSDQYTIFNYAIQFSGLAQKLSTTPFSTPGQRTRMHVGYSPQDAYQIVGFYSAFSTQEGRTIVPDKDAKDLPIVFLVNSNSGIPIEALALQQVGKAIILAEEAINDSSMINTQSISITDSYDVQIRISELVLQNGRTGIQPNLIVKDDAKNTFETALMLVRNFKPIPVSGKEIPTWIGRIIDKPYSEMTSPTLEYRLLAAFRFWGVINFFSPYKYLFEDWDTVIVKFIQLMEKASNTLEYNLAIAEMTTYIHDTHTGIRSDVLRKYFGDAPPPVSIRFVEGLPVITSFQDEVEAKNLKLELGDIILKIDGEDVKDRIERLKKYLSASSTQATMRRVGDILLYGPDNSEVTVTIKDRLNKIRDVKIPRKAKYFANRYQRSGDIVKILPDNIGYVDLDRLTVPMIDNMLEKLKDTRAIIFDMRSIPQGTGFAIARRLTDKPRIPIAIFRRPVITAVSSSSDLAGSNLSYSYTDYVHTNNLPKYKGKTVMLIDDRAQSQAETVGLVFKAANGTTWVGSATAGTDGEVTNLYLPGGIIVYFTGQELKHPDGRQLQRVGLIPDIEIKPTIKGILEGKDEVLEKAIEYLTNEFRTAQKQ